MTKNIKKLFALLLSALLLAGVLPFSAFADTASDVTTVGLEEVKVSANYAYLRIQVLEDSVAVFSNPTNSKYYISSATLLSALKSTNGYTLSYVLEEGGDAANAAHVVGGYVKASKAEANDVYIPVVCKADYSDAIRLDQNGSMWTETGADNVASTSVAAVGGKPSDDYSRKVEVTTDGLSGYYLMKLEGNKDTNVKEWIDDYHGSTVKDWIDNFDTTFTYVFNVYAEDGGSPVIYANSGHSKIKEYVLASFDSDGYLMYTKDVTTAGSRTDIKTKYKLTPNKWHQLAISFCSAVWRPLIFFDGEYIGCPDAFYDWQVYQIGIGADKSKAGTVYFDDVEYYEGYYDSGYAAKAAKLTLSGSSESVLVGSDGNINVDTAAITNATALFSALSSGADNMRLYADDSFSAEVTDVSANNVLVLSDIKNTVFKYYKISPIEFKLESVEKIATAAPGVYDISAKLEYNASLGKDATMILVVSGSDGRFERILCSETKSVQGEATFTISDVNTSGKKIDVFFIDNWSTYIPYFEKQLVE